MTSMFHVHVGATTVLVSGKSPGNACRKAFRKLIALGHIKRQPKTDRESGGWIGTSIECTNHRIASPRPEYSLR